jgi:hypothetical protein
MKVQFQTFCKGLFSERNHKAMNERAGRVYSARIVRLVEMLGFVKIIGIEHFSSSFKFISSIRK